MNEDQKGHLDSIIKATLGFTGILIVGVIGVFAAEIFRLGDVNHLIITVDNVASIR